jgi:RNA polymerase sigma-70 factor (ECF subfamily)
MKRPPTPRPTDDEDAHLIRAVLGGRKELFQRLIDKYQTGLYNFGLRLCPEERDAEEMVQDAFFQAYRFLHQFRFESRFKTWLYKIAASACDKKRKRTRAAREHEVSYEEFQTGKEKDPPLGGEPTWVSEPLDRLLNEELAGYIRKAVAALPEKYRLVLVLRDLEGFSTDETAHLLRLKPETVKVRLHRARFFLKNKLQRYFADGR